MSEETPIAPSIHVLMGRVLADVGPVAKSMKNVDAGYAARSIDDVITAVHDAMAPHGVYMLPTIEHAEHAEITVGKNNIRMQRAVLRIRWTFYGPNGDSVEAVTVGEANDSADKASNKAQSASLKYCLLHSFMIPLVGNENDADSSSPELGEEAKPKAPPKITRQQHEQITANSAAMTPEERSKVRDWIAANGLPEHIGQYSRAQADALLKEVERRTGPRTEAETAQVAS